MDRSCLYFDFLRTEGSVYIVITGQPGAGKTNVAIALANRLQAQGENCFLLHTDILKVTLRQLGVQELQGISTGEDVDCRLQTIRPYLVRQYEKALHDGYHIIVEGTLAVGFAPSSSGLYLDLVASEQTCNQRIQKKHISARESLVSRHSFAQYQLVLEKYRPEKAIVLDAEKTIFSLVEQIYELFLEKIR